MNIGNDMGQQFMFPKFRTGYYPQLPDKWFELFAFISIPVYKSWAAGGNSVSLFSQQQEMHNVTCNVLYNVVCWLESEATYNSIAQ